MNKILCIVLLLTFAAAYGQQQERIAIMHTVDNMDSINVADLGYLTNKLRDIASKVLPKNRYGIMTQQSIVDRLGSQERAEKECREATCLADLGRKISADYISQGRIGRFSGRLTIEVELYRVRGSTLIGAVTGDSKDLDGLLAVLESKAPKLFEDMAGGSSDVPEKPVPPPPVPPPVPLEPEPVPDSAFVLPVALAAKKECENKFNINELVFKIQSGFINQLKDCSAALAKNIALSKSPFGKKTELKEPKAFMMECTVDGIKQKLSSGIDEYIKPIKSFVQIVLDEASGSNGELDVAKLSKSISDMNIGELLDGIRKLAGEDECMVDEPYEPPVALEGKEEGEGSEEKKGKRRWSLGLRGGLNVSHLYAIYDNGYYRSGSYESTPGFQLGLVFDWAFSDRFHIQSGLMYIQKGAEVNHDTETFHNIEIPLLLSLKFSALRINAGPYFSLCDNGREGGHGSHSANGDGYSIGNGDFDFGISGGFGFDIGMFYIGVFYDYGFIDSYSYELIDNNRIYNSLLKTYNRTLGFNFGVNL